MNHDSDFTTLRAPQIVGSIDLPTFTSIFYSNSMYTVSFGSVDLRRTCQFDNAAHSDMT